jgi:hypothetical protein
MRRREARNPRAKSLISKVPLTSKPAFCLAPSGCQATWHYSSVSNMLRRRPSTVLEPIWAIWDMAFTYSHLLLSMSEVREPPVDCLLPSSRDLTSASSFSNRNNPRTSLGLCNLDPLPGMNLVGALVLVPLLTSLSVNRVNLQVKFLSSQCRVNRELHQNSIPSLSKGKQISMPSC